MYLNAADLARAHQTVLRERLAAGKSNAGCGGICTKWLNPGLAGLEFKSMGMSTRESVASPITRDRQALLRQFREKAARLDLMEFELEWAIRRRRELAAKSDHMKVRESVESRERDRLERESARERDSERFRSRR